MVQAMMPVMILAVTIVAAVALVIEVAATLITMVVDGVSFRLVYMGGRRVVVDCLAFTANLN